MDDAALVGRGQRVGDLARDGHGLRQGQRAFLQHIAEGATVNELEYQVLRALNFFQAVDGCDVRVIERREQLRLALETADSFRMLCEQVMQRLDRHGAVEACVVRAIDRAHSAFAQLCHDFVWPEAGTRNQ